MLLGLLGIIPSFVNASEITPRTTYYTFGHKITWNIENIWYYVDSSASSYSSLIAESADNWVHTGHGYNKLYPFIATTNKTLSAADFYNKSLGSNTLGVTWMYKRVNGNAIRVNGSNGAPTENWLFCEIELNPSLLNNYSYKLRKNVVVHEMGHCFGLAHNPSNKTVMYPYANGLDSSVNGVTAVDNQTFNYIYP